MSEGTYREPELKPLLAEINLLMDLVMALAAAEAPLTQEEVDRALMESSDIPDYATTIARPLANKGLPDDNLTQATICE